MQVHEYKETDSTSFVPYSHLWSHIPLWVTLSNWCIEWSSFNSHELLNAIFSAIWFKAVTLRQILHYKTIKYKTIKCANQLFTFFTNIITNKVGVDFILIWYVKVINWFLVDKQQFYYKINIISKVLREPKPKVLVKSPLSPYFKPHFH